MQTTNTPLALQQARAYLIDYIKSTPELTRPVVLHTERIALNTKARIARTKAKSNGVQ